MQILCLDFCRDDVAKPSFCMPDGHQQESHHGWFPAIRSMSLASWSFWKWKSHYKSTKHPLKPSGIWENDTFHAVCKCHVIFWSYAHPWPLAEIGDELNSGSFTVAHLANAANHPGTNCRVLLTILYKLWSALASLSNLFGHESESAIVYLHSI